MNCRKCGMNLLKQSQCQNCGQVVGEPYNETPTIISYNQMLKLCYTNHIFEEVHNNPNICKILNDDCCIHTCPLIEVVNNKITKIRK